MSPDQINALIAYVDAAVEEATDDGQSSDAGLISYRARRDAEEKLREALKDDE